MNAHDRSVSQVGETHLEIERRYLLDGLPAIPANAQRLEIEQGYLHDSAVVNAGNDRGMIDLHRGRLRRVTSPDGTVAYYHTTKTGEGLLRFERDQVISRQLFDQYWPRTEGRRLRKIRSRVPYGDVVWEIDAFVDLDLVLAEVELPAADAAVPIPEWLSPHIIQEVTGDPAYTNASIAARYGGRYRQ